MSRNVVSIINGLLEEVEGSKRTKVASSLAGTDGPQADKDPGTRRGESTHPSAKVDSGTMPARLGFRAAENEADVKKDQPVGVDQTKPNAGGSQDSHQLNIGMRQSATGEDPSVERKYKGRPDDPGTTAEADADTIGDKYAGLSWDAMSKLAAAKINQMMAAVVAETPEQPDADVKTATEAGRQLADVVAGQDEKTAADAAQLMLQYTIKEALDRAQQVGEFMRDFTAAKRANEEAAMMPPDEPVPSGGGEGLPTGPAAEGGAMPPMGGGKEEAAEGGMGGMGDMGGMGGGAEGGHDDAITELVHSLIEAGISPEQLMEALSDQSAADPAKQAHAMPSGQRLQTRAMAKQAAALQKSPKYRFKAATTEVERQSRAEIVSYIRELCNRH